MAYNFNKEAVVGDWEVKVDEWERYGYFEDQEGNGGGLWFEPHTAENFDLIALELVDYDGVYSLPRDVATALESLGYVVDSSFV